MTEQLPEGNPPARQAGVVSSFAAFLPQGISIWIFLLIG